MDIVPFSFEGREVRFVGTVEKPEWVAADAVAILYPEADKRNYGNYLKKVRAKWKGHKRIMTLSGEQEVVTLFEAGMYYLINRSNSPLAEPFQDWLCEEVLPSIRKTGSYALPQRENQIEDIDALLIQTQNAIAALISTRLELREVRQAVELSAARQECLEKRIQVVEVEQDRYQTPSGHKYTVLGFANKQGIEISRKEASQKGRKASALCRGQGIEIERIHDPRFGRVGLYPESVLLQVFAG